MTVTSFTQLVGFSRLRHTLLNHVLSNGVATGEKMFEPAVTSVFANVNLPPFVYFSSSSKRKYFFS